MHSADICLQPPSDGEASEEDSVPDEDGRPTIENLSGRQLSAEVTATLHTGGGRQELTDILSSESDTGQDPGPSKRRRGKTMGTSASGSAPSRRCVDDDLTKDEVLRFTWKDQPQPQAERDLSPATCFELFFDDDVCQLLLREIRRYAQQSGNHTFALDIPALKRFLAVLILSGYNPLPRRRMYWDVQTDVHNPAMADAMPRDRFDAIMRYLHLADNSTRPASPDRFRKARPLFDLVEDRFLRHFPVSRSLSVDESMVRYYGKHGAKQFIRGKPIRLGYKVWCCCSPDRYLASLELYQGAVAGQKPSVLGVGVM